MAPLFIRPMHPTWTEQWWPISYLQDLDPQRPNRFTLLERDLSRASANGVIFY